MILLAYRHGLRASELCDLQWSQIELAGGRFHVRRSKRGAPGVHSGYADDPNRLIYRQCDHQKSIHRNRIHDGAAFVGYA
jgi:integrase